MQDKIFTEILCFSVLTDQLKWKYILALKIGIISDGGCKILFPENADMLPNIKRSSMIRHKQLIYLSVYMLGGKNCQGFF